MLTFFCMSKKHYLKAWEMKGKIPGDFRGCGPDVGKERIRGMTQELPPGQSGTTAMAEVSEGNSPFGHKPVVFFSTEIVLPTSLNCFFLLLFS